MNEVVVNKTDADEVVANEVARHEARRGSQTLARGLRILGALRDASDGCSVAELARALDLPRAIVTRLLVTLEEERYVERASGRAYRLGPELIALGKAVRADLREIASTVLRDLAEDVAATVVLVVRDGDHAVVINVVEPTSTDLRLSFRLGSRHRLHQGAEGMAILAGNPPLPGERREVTQARSSGYVVSAGEILPGTWGLAVPVAPYQGECSMSVGVITAQALDEAGIAVLVTAAARELAARVALTGELR
jgi:DNA-binding IclR family transcriptional regulator